jgi:type I restriction enzyme M protein
MFKQVFKNVDDILQKDAGCGSELDYIEQTSWILFLKYLEDLEKDRKTASVLSGVPYKPIIEEKYKWSNWAVPKTHDGKIDHHKAQSGDDLKSFVDDELFPFLRKFKSEAINADTIEYKIGEIFSELKNKIQTGYSLREILNLIDTLRFKSKEEKHEMSHLYEDKIKNMGNAGRNGGEYYTPRPLIKTIVKVIAPKVGDKIYDGAVGSAGFLAEAFEYLKTSKDLSTSDMEILQKSTFYGREKKSLAYIIGTMNMILHGVEAPNIIHTNTLAENLADIQDKDRYDIVLANPPFGGKEHIQIQQNFPIRTRETAYLFLQHFIKILKAGGRAGVVIKNTFLSNGGQGSADSILRKFLLESCNLHTILDMPKGTFSGAGVQTVVLFYEKGLPTKDIWYYQLNPGRNLGKTNALNEDDLLEFIELEKIKGLSENSWLVNIDEINKSTYDLSVNNPNRKDESDKRKPQEILAEIEALDFEASKAIAKIKEML